MSTMMLQQFAVWDADNRHTHYLQDPDLKVNLARSGETALQTTLEESVVMVRIGLDDEPSDLVVVDAVGAGTDLDAVNKAIAALLVVRDALAQ